MERFVSIAAGLDVGPALAELAAQPEYWMHVNDDGSTIIPLLGVMNSRLLDNELREVWRLVDTALHAAAIGQGDRGALVHCRVGRIPHGGGLPPHYDGIDGVRQRRYQLALKSEPGAEVTVDGETRCWRPGEVWQIDASRLHSVANRSGADRITILFDTAS